MIQLSICISKANNGYLLYGLPYSILAASERHQSWIEHSYMEPISYINVDGDVCIEYMDASTYAGKAQRHDPIQYIRHISSELYDVKAFVQQHIMNGEYLFLFVDEYYIPYSSLGNKMHYLHEILVYGFDEKGVIYETLSENDKYENFFITYDQLQKALCAGETLQPTQATADWLIGARAFTAKLKQEVPPFFSMESKLVNHTCKVITKKSRPKWTA